MHRHARVQKIVAWNEACSEDPHPRSKTRLPVMTEKEARIFHVLAEERGPLPLPALAKLAKVSRRSSSA